MIDQYKGYLPEEKAQIRFEIMSTGCLDSEKDKILFFQNNVKDEHLVNLSFCEDPSLSWFGMELTARPKPMAETTTTVQLFDFELSLESSEG